MEATAKYIKVSPRKARLVAETVRKLRAPIALERLELLQKRAADPVAKALKSAVANATHNAKVPMENLTIKTIIIEEGPVLKRWRPVSRGRAHPYKKRMSHIKVVLEEVKK